MEPNVGEWVTEVQPVGLGNSKAARTFEVHLAEEDEVNCLLMRRLGAGGETQVVVAHQTRTFLFFGGQFHLWLSQGGQTIYNRRHDVSSQPVRVNLPNNAKLDVRAIRPVWVCRVEKKEKELRLSSKKEFLGTSICAPRGVDGWWGWTYPKNVRQLTVAFRDTSDPLGIHVHGVAENAEDRDPDKGREYCVLLGSGQFYGWCKGDYRQANDLLPQASLLCTEEVDASTRPIMLTADRGAPHGIRFTSSVVIVEPRTEAYNQRYGSDTRIFSIPNYLRVR